MTDGLRHYRLNPDHSVEPVDVRLDENLAQWARLIGSGDWRVDWTEVGPGLFVSTIFLGLDHSFGRGPPLLFETMTFDDYGDGGQWRYSTWDEAVAGHADAVAKLRAKLTKRTKHETPQANPKA